MGLHQVPVASRQRLLRGKLRCEGDRLELAALGVIVDSPRSDPGRPIALPNIEQSRVAAAERGNVHPRIETDPRVPRENVRGSASCHQKPGVEPHTRTLSLA